MKRKFLSLFLCLTMLLTVMQFSAVVALADTEENNVVIETTSTDNEIDSVGPEETVPANIAEQALPTETNPESAAEPVLAYVPLDNRPVNVDRVFYEAEAAGFEVVMPDEDLYATRLDGQPFNANGTQFGDSQKLMDWILAMDQTTDYFVISLDQLLSGGLVNSRVLTNTTYTDEYKIIDEIIDLSRNNHVYIIDTVARLATCTVGYKGATLDTYNYLRQYNATPRKLLTGESLTVKNIVAGYRYNEKGFLITTKSSYTNVVKDSQLARERKLHLIDYLLSKDDSAGIKYFIGIDDSNSQNTVQTNEINYIRMMMGTRGFIYSGTDELGMMAVLSLMIDHYHTNVNAAAIYFGNTEESSAGSIYDLETVKENVEEHLKSIGVNLTDPENANLEILVLTLPEKSVLNSKYISAMIDHINSNISKGTPTIVINSAPNAYSSNLEYRMVRECEMSMLLAYSSWGTVGNSIGLALGNGISRYLYLHSRSSSSNTADIAFMKGLIFSYEKDISYLRAGGQTLFNDYITAQGWPTSNFYKDPAQVVKAFKALDYILKTAEYNVTVSDILNNLTDCRYLKGLGGECGIIGNINLTNYSAPFFRTNEIRFDINVQISDATINHFDNAMTISMPYSPPAGQLVYSLNLYGRDNTGKLHKIPCTYDKSAGQVKFSAANQYTSMFVDALSMDAERAYSLFTDADKTAWYFDYMLYVYEKGLMNGVASNIFEPNKPMTRAMLVNTLYKMAGTPQAASNVRMSDIADGSWYKPAVDWALANKIVSGYADGRFGPDDPITREQLAVLLWRYANYAGLKIAAGGYPGISAYTDGLFVYENMRVGFNWVCSNGIITGTASNGATLLMPQSSATRAEVAAVLKRFVDMGISLPDNLSQSEK
ncbi:MAG: hypothetical protein H6Q64_157 [Firmicutes bacterium]|nr:hypothetical protein [Bacillota bacterium]